MIDQEEEFYEALDAGECVRLLGVGNSMRPLLRNGLDYVFLKKTEKQTIRKGDVILYRSAGKLVLHRVVKVNGDSYHLLGDGNTRIEKNIREADILGKAIGFERKDRYFPVESFWYRCYWRIWVFLRPLRPLIKKINVLIKKLFGRYEDEDALKQRKK